MLPAHFDDATDEISRSVKPNLIKMLHGLPESPTRNTGATYKQCQTLHDYNTN